VLEEEDELLQPSAKKPFQVPSLEVCLGKENLQLLLEEEAHNTGEGFALVGCDVNSSSSESFVDLLGRSEALPVVKEIESKAVRESSGEVLGFRDKLVCEGKKMVEDVADHEVQLGLEANLEATGPWAAGKLSGANVSAWQGPC
jgi:hypothetical protein